MTRRRSVIAAGATAVTAVLRLRAFQYTNAGYRELEREVERLGAPDGFTLSDAGIDWSGELSCPLSQCRNVRGYYEAPPGQSMKEATRTVKTHVREAGYKVTY